MEVGDKKKWALKSVHPPLRLANFGSKFILEESAGGYLDCLRGFLRLGKKAYDDFKGSVLENLNAAFEANVFGTFRRTF
ncbi:hypothetical protein ACTXT7_003016 [Hymenolepis weldensis]